ncbi:hypothetical protein DFQ05_0631 [Winogradskyella wandonensis]|uniref:Uncharacterized protein n=1 Tax=Winogradskyella wandonensis TaxID=1442586 RepID=A0A4R1KVA3_9FLAO|nr:hypothetical protein [Winogradskyella wandonensis]TCK69116.1 hypothetical protein DFQ05_0631 [Winogradskyella wandonensis]
MRKITFILLLISVSFVSAQSFDSANAYLDFVGEHQENITQKMWQYTKAVAHGKSDRAVENKRKSLVKTIDRAMGKIDKANGYDGDTFKTQLLEKLQFNKDLLNDDYAKIIDMKAVAEQSYDAMEAYMLAQELADKKLEEIQKTYETNLYTFANKHNIQIIESETDLSKKMKISNTVFKYYKELYLIYFKVFINEVYLMDALNKGDVAGIQQNANALSESAKEGLSILKDIEPYNQDTSIIDATKKTFEFFKDEAEINIPKITDFLILNENFEKIKATLEKTPERKRTKKQIDDYNNKVNEMNKGVKTYNDTNAKLNKKRAEVINNLNTVNQNFLSRHIPND